MIRLFLIFNTLIVSEVLFSGEEPGRCGQWISSKWITIKEALIGPYETDGERFERIKREIREEEEEFKKQQRLAKRKKMEKEWDKRPFAFEKKYKEQRKREKEQERINS